MKERIERDSMGEVRLPADVYYGAQTQRAVENFPIALAPLPSRMIQALALVKWAAASANEKLGLLGKKLSPEQIEALKKASLEVADGNYSDQFPVDIYQTGSGTSSNMNMNEVISNRAIELCGQDRFEMKKMIHPNDHVNMGQSTNDIFPTAIHVAAAKVIRESLIPALSECASALQRKANEWADILKIGRTHLADATPMTLGQEFGSFARQIELAAEDAQAAEKALHELPAGGTAVGSGINTHPKFASEVAGFLAEKTGIPFCEAVNHFEANAQRTGVVRCHALLKAIAVTLMSVANNIRWLGSGPRCGYYEIALPDLQPGSSIMPGKVNPVLCESMIQVAARVMGNDSTIAVCGGVGGQFQLNITMPLMASVLLESAELMARCVDIFTKRCVEGLKANREKCESSVEQSLSMVTSLNPHIGYEKAAALAKEAFKTGKTIRELCIEQNVLPPETLEEALDPMKMTRPMES
ncbi:MAG: class II fumarate hydratase [Planctomycetaceae bacterium]|nr:class II fumarate hydratase [Planctomycetaceae bacterium]